MHLRFNIRWLLVLTFVVAAIAAVFQQSGPISIRFLIVALIANSILAAGGLVFALMQIWRGFDRDNTT